MNDDELYFATASSQQSNTQKNTRKTKHRYKRKKLRQNTKIPEIETSKEIKNT